MKDYLLRKYFEAIDIEDFLDDDEEDQYPDGWGWCIKKSWEWLLKNLEYSTVESYPIREARKIAKVLEQEYLKYHLSI